MNFDEAFNKLLRLEGGYVDHPADPGRATRYGITEATARAHGYRGDMRALPQDVARAIYRRSYWDAVRADELPRALRYPVFDAAVNSGPAQAVKWVQQALGVTADGIIGPVTLGELREWPAEQTLRRMLGARLQFMTDLSTWPTFGRGWARRVAELLCA